MTPKEKVLDSCPEAFCELLKDKQGFCIWPDKASQWDGETPVMGRGKTAKQAWDNAWDNYMDGY